MALFESRPTGVSSGLFPSAPSSGSSLSGMGTTFVTVVGGIILMFIAVVFFNYIQKRSGLPGVDLFESKSSGDKTPIPVDGKTKTVIPAGDIPIGAGIDYGLQYWMYISNWDYRFGQNKEVVKRVASNDASVVGPRIYLAPNENTLHVQISLYPTDGRAGAAQPGASSTGDSFTCSVENVPLQSWFSVSVTVFQRNLDIYINGRLVKSCVLPGIPKPALGDVIIADNGGFAGSVCNLNGYSTMLSPDDTKSFYTKGTTCAPPPAAGKVNVDQDSIFITLFGYTFRFSTLSKKGEELSSYTL